MSILHIHKDQNRSIRKTQSLRYVEIFYGITILKTERLHVVK